MNTYLFVYGTLMHNFPNKMAEFLRKNSEFVEKGTVSGILYIVTNWHFPYPIAVLKDNSIQKIHGEIFQIHTEKVKEVFEVLDKYEGVGDEFPQPNEYERKQIKVSTQAKEYLCWAYSSLAESHNLPRISSGDFRQYLKENPR